MPDRKVKSGYKYGKKSENLFRQRVSQKTRDRH
jgi:hypothetical protein